jgi:hypothetical protein
MTISESDFDVINTREVRHRATDARWSTHEYENVDDTGSSTTESPGNAGVGNLPTADELRPHAVALLRKLARHAARQRG